MQKENLIIPVVFSFFTRSSAILTIAFLNMSQSDEILIASAESLNESEIEEELQKVAEAEEEFDPKQPEDLTTVFQKAEAEEEDAERDAEDLGAESQTDESDDQDESDDSIVCDEIEYTCKDHNVCVKMAKTLDEQLLSVLSLKARTSSAKQRQAAIAEVLCDHYSAL